MQSAGIVPDEREELKINESREDMDWAVELSIVAEIYQDLEKQESRSNIS